MKLDKIEVEAKFKILQIREIAESGGYHRRVLSPDMTLASDEHQEIKETAEELWTDEVKEVWTKHQANQNNCIPNIRKLEG